MIYLGYQRYKLHLKRFNERAQNLAKEAGFEDMRLTSYAIRHTFATELYRKNVSKGKISEIFGHKGHNSIDTYISPSDPDMLDDDADRVLDEY